MVKIEVELPDRIDSDIDRLVEQGDFLNREQATEELLSLGISSYDTATEPEEDIEEEMFSQTVDDQQDPADHRDEPL